MLEKGHKLAQQMAQDEKRNHITLRSVWNEIVCSVIFFNKLFFFMILCNIKTNMACITSILAAFFNA